MTDYDFHRDGELQVPSWGPALVKTRVEQELIDILLKKGMECRKKNLDHRHELAGQIENEYYYEKGFEEWFAQKFAKYLDAYIHKTEELVSDAFIQKKQPFGIHITGLWINYQQANEYNPPHNHIGDVSFVLYLQVPQEIKKENEEMQGVHNNAGPGTIHFDFPGIQLPFCGTTVVHLPEVGDLFMFPSWLMHHVPSFTSNVERISVSGNMTFEDEVKVKG